MKFTQERTLTTLAIALSLAGFLSWFPGISEARPQDSCAGKEGVLQANLDVVLRVLREAEVNSRDEANGTSYLSEDIQERMGEISFHCAESLSKGKLNANSHYTNGVYYRDGRILIGMHLIDAADDLAPDKVSPRLVMVILHELVHAVDHNKGRLGSLATLANECDADIGAANLILAAMKSKDFHLSAHGETRLSISNGNTGYFDQCPQNAFYLDLFEMAGL